MDRVMTKQESYVQRRQLFKNIWETAMHIDDKEEIMNKPKVIKTLRLDEVDKYPTGKSKKQRIKNLRHVCNKILDFCDRQDADDKFYEQMASTDAQQPKTENKVKKLKTIRTRKKVMKAKSLYSPRKLMVARITASDGKEEFSKSYEKTSRPTSPIKIKRTTTIRPKSTIISKPIKLKASPERIKMVKKPKPTDIPGEPTVARRRVVKQKRSKRKKKSDTGVTQPLGTLDWPE